MVLQSPECSMYSNDSNILEYSTAICSDIQAKQPTFQPTGISLLPNTPTIAPSQRWTPYLKLSISFVLSPLTNDGLLKRMLETDSMSYWLMDLVASVLDLTHDNQIVLWHLPTSLENQLDARDDDGKDWVHVDTALCCDRHTCLSLLTNYSSTIHDTEIVIP